VLWKKAKEVAAITRQYAEDLEEEHPHEIWALLYYSLPHMVTYWLRTCTPEKTEEMAELVDVAILEAVHEAAGIEFDAETVAKDILRLPTRLKGGGIRSMVDLIVPAFLGATLDILPRCIDRKDQEGEKTKGVYNRELIDVIGEGAYYVEGHMNARFLKANNAGTYPMSIQFAWQMASLDATFNCGLTVDSSVEEWGKLGPLAAKTPANVRNRGADARPRRT